MRVKHGMVLLHARSVGDDDLVPYWLNLDAVAQVTCDVDGETIFWVGTSPRCATLPFRAVTERNGRLGIEVEGEAEVGPMDQQVQSFLRRCLTVHHEPGRRVIAAALNTTEARVRAALDELMTAGLVEKNAAKGPRAGYRLTAVAQRGG